MMPVEAPRSVYLFKLDCEINLWIGDRPSEAGLASIRCLPVPPRCWHGAPVADLHGVHKRPGLLARAGSKRVTSRPASPLRQHCSCAACTPGERAGRACPRARRRPPALPPKADETVWRDDPRSDSGPITISMIARTGPRGATSSFHDEGKYDKTGDESRYHPQ